MAQEEDFGALTGKLLAHGRTSISRTVINNDELQGDAVLYKFKTAENTRFQGVFFVVAGNNKRESYRFITI